MFHSYEVMALLVCLLHIIDYDERPSLRYVYESMYRIHLGIKKLFNYEQSLYKPYAQIIK